MDEDKLIEILEDSGVDKAGVAKVIEIIRMGKSPEGESASERKSSISALEYALIFETNPTKKAQIAAKLISIGLDE